jgi:6-phosphogluconolactonase
MLIKKSIIKTVWPDPIALSLAVANLIVFESKKAIQEKGYFTIALSGCYTPKILFELLAQATYKNNIDWKKTIIAFGDERFVPFTSNDSNYKMANETLLSKVPLLQKNILKIKTEKITPEVSAKNYEQQIKKYIPPKKAFDLILLGLGEEGHTASIFPGSKLITDKKHWVQNVWVEEKQMERISFTLPFINQAKNIAFLVSGENKKNIVNKIFTTKKQVLPAGLVEAKENTYWFLDNAANGS